MIRAFHTTIWVNAKGSLAANQMTPRIAFNDFYIAEVEDDQIIAYTCPDNCPDSHFGSTNALNEVVLEDLRKRRLSPGAFFERYPLAEVAQGVDDALLHRYPSSSAAVVGLGSMAIFARREQGMIELASLEKPGDYFEALSMAISLDPTLIQTAVANAPAIARQLYRGKAESGLTEHISDETNPVYQEPYKSIYLEGVGNYLCDDGKSPIGLDWIGHANGSNPHSTKVFETLLEYFSNGKGAQLEAFHLPTAMLKVLTSRKIQVKASDLYAPIALQNNTGEHIRAGYDWRFSAALGKYYDRDVYNRASEWAQDMLKIFKSKDMRSQDFWGLDGAEESAKGRDILKAIHLMDTQGFSQILQRLPQWAKMACLALGVVSIHEVQDVPSAGRDKSMSRDLGL